MNKKRIASLLVSLSLAFSNVPSALANVELEKDIDKIYETYDNAANIDENNKRDYLLLLGNLSFDLLGYLSYNETCLNDIEFDNLASLTVKITTTDLTKLTDEEVEEYTKQIIEHRKQFIFDCYNNLGNKINEINEIVADSPNVPSGVKYNLNMAEEMYNSKGSIVDISSLLYVIEE